VRILVVNAGSSSLKLRVLDDADVLVGTADLGPPDGPNAVAEVAAAIRELGEVDAVGHRVVHGAAEFTGPVAVTPAIRERLAALSDLAPLHQPKSLAGLDAMTAVLPSVPAVACFDTAFHAGLPAAAATYALPAAWRERWPLRRFGFHGLSHAYIARRVEALWAAQGAAIPRPFRVVSCHLGAGASLTAIVDGRSVDTTMGFTPLEGLVMATRSGNVDPGLVLWLQTNVGLSAGDVTDGLERDSGLLGLAGSGDMRDVVAGVGRGDASAVLALDVYVHRMVGLAAAMAASAGGLDALVFTGGVGEHAPLVRERAAQGLTFLGVGLDEAANDAATGAGGQAPDAEITTPNAPVRTFVIEAREDLEIAAEVRRLLG
jgi:acetate kinase